MVQDKVTRPLSGLPSLTEGSRHLRVSLVLRDVEVAEDR